MFNLTSIFQIGWFNHQLVFFGTKLKRFVDLRCFCWRVSVFSEHVHSWPFHDMILYVCAPREFNVDSKEWYVKGVAFSKPLAFRCLCRIFRVYHMCLQSCGPKDSSTKPSNFIMIHNLHSFSSILSWEIAAFWDTWDHHLSSHLLTSSKPRSS